MEDQQKTVVGFNGKMDTLYTDLNRKVGASDSYVKELDFRISLTASSSKGSDTKPHQPCHAVTLRSGKQLEPVVRKGLSSEDIIDMEKVEDDVISEEILPTSIDAHHSRRSTQMGNPAIKLSDGENNIPTSVDRHTTCVDRRNAEIDPISPSSVLKPVERVYNPKVPYPMPRKSKKEMEDMRCKEMMDKVMIELPLIDKVKLSCPLKRYVRRMVINGVSPEEGALLTKDISAIYLNEIPQKRMMVAQTAKAFKRQENTLSGKIDANSRYSCNAITLNGDISAEEIEEIEEIDERFFDMLLEEIEDKGVAETPEIVNERVHTPIPTHPRAGKSYDALVEKINWQLHRKSGSWQFPEVQEFRDLPCVKKVIDKAYAEEIDLNEAVDLIYLECAAILHSILPEKFPDPVDIPTPSLRKLPKKVCDKLETGNSHKQEVNKLHSKDFNAKNPKAAGRKKRLQRRAVIEEPLMTLIPKKQVGDMIEYKLQYGGTSRPFAKVKAISTPEFKAKGQAAMDEMMHRILKPKMLTLKEDIRVAGTCRSTHTTRIDRRTPPVGPDFSEAACFRVDLNVASPRAVVKQKASHPTLHSPWEKLRYALSKPKPSNIINKTFQGTKTVLQLTKPRGFRRALVSSIDDFAGKRSVPHYMGHPHGPNAYTPPWMKRKFSERHPFVLTRPPDAHASAKSS
ncbi:hypothetical protein V5N11_015487 [Cardamine amara subsp. amara]|uniref:Uncharacterized protein n=1 Tax=Cardamine amara subsp. amara TaxID=228776 RepID=A0ABD1BQI9_CARAN